MPHNLVDLASLPIAQLNQVKTQLTQELQHLTSSFQSLKAAQAKFRDCINSARDGLKNEGSLLCTYTVNEVMSNLSRLLGNPILVPLTPSLYVPGTLASTSTVLVDVGTGFFVEKTPDAAQAFYKRKVEELGKNLEDLEKIVQQKQGNLNVVEDGELGRRRGCSAHLVLMSNSTEAEGHARKQQGWLWQWMNVYVFLLNMLKISSISVYRATAHALPRGQQATIMMQLPLTI